MGGIKAVGEEQRGVLVKRYVRGGASCTGVLGPAPLGLAPVLVQFHPLNSENEAPLGSWAPVKVER